MFCSPEECKWYFLKQLLVQKKTIFWSVAFFGNVSKNYGLTREEQQLLSMCWETPSDSDTQRIPDTDTHGGFKWVARS